MILTRSKASWVAGVTNGFIVRLVLAANLLENLKTSGNEPVVWNEVGCWKL